MTPRPPPLLLTTLVVVAAVATSSHELALAQARGSALEARLMAPCCWTQTLDVHDSPDARALRAEIEARLARGESTAEVEANLVARYGERIRAIPHAGYLDPIGLGVAIALCLSALGLVLVARRWVRPAPDATPAHASPEAPDALDAQLEAELAELPDA